MKTETLIALGALAFVLYKKANAAPTPASGVWFNQAVQSQANTTPSFVWNVTPTPSAATIANLFDNQMVSRVQGAPGTSYGQTRNNGLELWSGSTWVANISNAPGQVFF